MIRVQFLLLGITSALFLHGCGKILEPVSLGKGEESLDVESVQEEFEIKIQSLTFKSAQKVSSAPYQRWLMQTGIGSKADLLDEAELITSSVPPSTQTQDYLLGVGDQLKYTQLNEFVTSSTELPAQQVETDYLLGVGDELTLIQLNEVNSGSNINISNILPDDDGEIDGSILASESVLQTSGLIGSDGNILLLGLGSINAENRSLNEIQTEVRNILIRNGLAPSFQLEITGFNSKKAFVALSNRTEDIVLEPGKNIISITNLPVTLKELSIIYGLAPASGNNAVVTLTRNGQKYRMTSGVLFENSTQAIIIQDKDQIEIEETQEDISSVELKVGSKGNILIPALGSFRANNRSLSEVQKDISTALVEKGLIPNFQLEVFNFKSKRFFLISKDDGGKVVPLTNAALDLKEVILSNMSRVGSSSANGKLSTVELIRNGISYRMTLADALTGRGKKVKIQDGDHIEIKDFEYKTGKVFALSGLGGAKVVPIDPSKRETLADILFTGNGALSNINARRSEVYLLRGRNPSIAYHLDTQNVSRILVASNTELRPNDIVFVAERPIISFARTLGEITPLRILLKDARNGTLID
jgi:protein involved in polysaccharide export with SLBB domain